MRYSNYYFNGSATEIPISASGNVVITGSAVLASFAVLSVSGHVVITGNAVIQLFGGEIFTYESADILPWDVESETETPMSIESADLTPLVVSS